MRILLAEDNPVNQQVLLRMLDKLGCDVEVVSDGAAAASRAESEAFDVILMDMQMPGLNGLEATRSIRDSEDSGPPVYIIALTANAMGEHRSRCIEAGMDDYLSKPFNLEQLRRKLDASRFRNGSTRTAQAIDPQVMQAFRESMGPDDPEFLNELFDDFLVDAARVRSEIHSGLKEHDAPRVRIAAHSLKANCGILGAFKLADLSEMIERFAETAQFSNIRLYLARFEGALSEVSSELRRMKAETPTYA